MLEELINELVEIYPGEVQYILEEYVSLYHYTDENILVTINIYGNEDDCNVMVCVSDNERDLKLGGSLENEVEYNLALVIKYAEHLVELIERI